MPCEVGFALTSDTTNQAEPVDKIFGLLGRNNFPPGKSMSVLATPLVDHIEAIGFNIQAGVFFHTHPEGNYWMKMISFFRGRQIPEYIPSLMPIVKRIYFSGDIADRFSQNPFGYRNILTKNGITIFVGSR